jgi:hypothetical protein
MGDVDPALIAFTLEAEVIRPIRQPVLGPGDLVMGEVRQGT